MKRRSARRTPAQERSRALCAAIEVAAAHVLVELGYEGATTARIAERAGVSVGSVYQYFDDKDAIFDALAQRILDALVDAVEPAVSASGLSLDARLELASVNVLRVVGPFPHVLRRLAAVPGTRFHERLSSARRRATEATRTLLELHGDEVVVVDRTLGARILVDVAEGLVLNFDPSDDAPRIAAEARRLVVRYCTAAPAQAPRARGARQRRA